MRGCVWRSRMADGADRAQQVVGAGGNGRAGGDDRGRFPAGETGDSITRMTSQRTGHEVYR